MLWSPMTNWWVFGALPAGATSAPLPMSDASIRDTPGTVEQFIYRVCVHGRTSGSRSVRDISSR